MDLQGEAYALPAVDDGVLLLHLDGPQRHVGHGPLQQVPRSVGRCMRVEVGKQQVINKIKRRTRPYIRSSPCPPPPPAVSSAATFPPHGRVRGASCGLVRAGPAPRPVVQRVWPDSPLSSRRSATARRDRRPPFRPPPPPPSPRRPTATRPRPALRVARSSARRDVAPGTGGRRRPPPGDGGGGGDPADGGVAYSTVQLK